MCSVGFEDRVKVEIYEQLFHLNKGYDEIITALAALRQHPAFPASELDRFTAVSKETRASAYSFLAAILEATETADAGPLTSCEEQVGASMCTFRLVGPRC